MKNIIELPNSELKAALTGLSKVVGRRSTLPVLQTIRLRRDESGFVTLQGTDLDSFASYQLKNVQQGAPVEFLVPIERLQKAVKQTKQAVSVYSEEKKAVIIRTLLSNTP